MYRKGLAKVNRPRWQMATINFYDVDGTISWICLAMGTRKCRKLEKGPMGEPHGGLQS